MTEAKYKIVPYFHSEEAKITYSVWEFKPSEFVFWRTWQWNSGHETHSDAERFIGRLVDAEDVYNRQHTTYYDQSGARL